VQARLQPQVRVLRLLVVEAEVWHYAQSGGGSEFWCEEPSVESHEGK